MRMPAARNSTGIVERVRAITGRVDLVHANNSRDAFDSGADRHANMSSGQIDPETIASIVREAGCDVIVETPREGQADDIDFLRKAAPGRIVSASADAYSARTADGSVRSSGRSVTRLIAVG